MSGNKPNLTLSMDDKIYLAVTKTDLDKLAFVYTLACLKTDKRANTFNLNPTREIHAFKNKEAAELYYNTIEQIVDVNASDETKQPIFNANEALINRFVENIR